MQSPTAIRFFASGFTLMSGNTGGNVRYRRVARDEDNEAEDKKKAQSDRIERFTAKLHALFWVCSVAENIFWSYQLFSSMCQGVA